jgi:hypothetical protein
LWKLVAAQLSVCELINSSDMLGFGAHFEFLRLLFESFSLRFSVFEINGR